MSRIYIPDLKYLLFCEHVVNCTIFYTKLKIPDTMSKEVKNNASGGALYFFGLIGAAVYYISTATSFGLGVVGFLKALVWPAFLVFEALKTLGA